MIAFLPSLMAVTLTGVLVLGVAGVRRLYEARRARREAAARALARHPAQFARRPLRRHCPGLPIDGEPLSEDDLATYTQIMMTPPIGSTQARETGADEGAT